MDRNFLYSMVALLALANATIYIQKTNPSFFSRFIPHAEKSENWIKEDPGWNNQDFPKSDNLPQRVDPVPPQSDPVPPRAEPQAPPRSQPQPQQPFRRPFQRNDSCPGCRPG